MPVFRIALPHCGTNVVASDGSNVLPRGCATPDASPSTRRRS